MSNKTIVNRFCIDFVTGPIPPEIFKLTKLEFLSFQMNQLTGRQFSQFYSMILKAYLYVKWDRGEPVHHPLFRCFVLTLYRANSARNRQIDEFAADLFISQPADRSINSQILSNDLEGVSLNQIKSLVNQFTISLLSLFFLTLYRTNSARNRQIDEFAGAWFT